MSPSDLDSTDSITNEGNSQTRPFKSLQRALIEAARFSYQIGNNNDIVEKTTILLMPGEHLVDNRPGYGILNNSGVKALTPAGAEVDASIFDLTLDSNFDLNQSDNILYKYNSIHGGVIVPRGTSIVGLDLRKTKIRPKYVPNPTDNTPNSAIFRITGGCYFWQFSIFDGNQNSEVYINSSDTERPTFSHHKLTVFEYADGVNKYDRTGIDDLNMYYYKLSVAYDAASTRNIQNKFPTSTQGFASRRPEYEIVGAFAADPISIVSAVAGDGVYATNEITIKTLIDHNLDVGTPIKINGVNPPEYNVSAVVTTISETDPKEFTYTLAESKGLRTPASDVTGASVTIETDTVDGASPYIFNCSLRSVYGMNGMHADGDKATGFKSMVVAQFTGVSLQKDDRAFVKYSKSNREYQGITIAPSYSPLLASQSSSTNPSRVYHLDSGAIYRDGWETTHVSITNDAILQIVSVFAIGYNKHFYADTGGDASITNSNSNFGQFALISEGFKKEAFEKDDTSYLTHIITPKAIASNEEDLDWLRIDTIKLDTVLQDKLYLFGFTSEDIKPPAITQGYRIGAKKDDVLYLNQDGNLYEATITMLDEGLGHTTSAVKEYAINTPSENIFSVASGSHTLSDGEKVIIRSLDGDLPENVMEDTVYYVIRIDATKFKLASTKSNAELGEVLTVYGGTNLKILSRVTDKDSGDVGHPIQWDGGNNNWYICVNGIAGGQPPSTLYTAVAAMKTAGTPAKTEPTYVKRKSDDRILDDKIYKLRLSIPGETTLAKNPENGFVMQESSRTGYRINTDFTKTDDLTRKDYDYARNLRYIRSASYNSSSQTATIDADRPHNLNVGDTIVIKSVKSANNTTGIGNSDYNGTFTVNSVPDNMSFTYVPGRVLSITGTNNFSGNVTADISLPRFERIDMQSNVYLYRNEIFSDYNTEDNSDGVYHAYPLNANNSLPSDEQGFSSLKYSQNVVNLYPQLDRDNPIDNPKPSKSFSLRAPLGEVATNYPDRSITRETVDTINTNLGIGLPISGVINGVDVSTITFERDHNLRGLQSAQVSNNSGFTNGVYYNVKIFTNVGLSNWNGTLANVTVESNAITSFTITNSGSGWSAGGHGYFDTSVIGSGTGKLSATVGGANLTDNHLGTYENLTVQFTGSNTTDDSYFRLSTVPGTNQIGIITATGDTRPTPDQYAFIVGPSIRANVEEVGGQYVFTTVNSVPHGLVAGNKIQYNDSNNINRGELIVEKLGGPVGGDNTIRFITKTAPSGILPSSNGWILKHGLSSNDSVSEKGNENLSVRGAELFNNEVGICTVGTVGTDDTVEVTLLNNKVGISERFDYGSYAQIGSEIVRIKSSTLTGANLNKLKVLRGVLGTQKQPHTGGLLIKKIKPIPVEFHRPSILRASGHTFEYLGYGPGNYSTALPQVQIRTLTEKEEFLSQSQERSAGAVVYTGMNNKGDFYIGNQKKSSLTGEEVTFDTPIPSVAGEDPARLSVVFDEVTIKERLVVEGGKSNTSLTQFDGPVTFNKDTNLNGDVRIKSPTQSEAYGNGALTVVGGVGIGKNLNVNGNIKVYDNKKIIAGTDDDFEIYYDAASTGHSVLHSGSKTISIRSGNTVEIEDESGNSLAEFHKGGNVELYWRGTPATGETVGKKLETTGKGVQIYDECHAVSFHGDGSGLSGAGAELSDASGTQRVVVTSLTSDSMTAAATSAKLTFNATTDTLSAHNFTTESDSADANFSSITSDGGLELTRSDETLTAGGPYIDFKKLKVSGSTGVDMDARIQMGINSSSDYGSLIFKVVNDVSNLPNTVGVGNLITRLQIKPKDGSTYAGGVKVTGELEVTGDITALTSDIRLKDEISPITKALEKVKSISGFTYKHNETAKVECDIDTGDQRFAGVSAQEIQEVLPEAVKPAPSNNEYLTVQYEKLVPLLIEAVKELSAKVDTLEAMAHPKPTGKTQKRNEDRLDALEKQINN